MSDDPRTARILDAPDRADAERAPGEDESTGRRGGVAVIINGHRIPLAASTDRAALMEEFAAAVSAEARFVHFEGLWGQTYDVLVTASTQVIFSHVPISFEVSVFDSAWSDVFDLDL